MKANEKQIENTLAQIGSKLKELRVQKGYSSYETFALDNDLDRKQYWRMENGSNITISTLLKILQIHQISLKEFFKDFS